MGIMQYCKNITKIASVTPKFVCPYIQIYAPVPQFQPPLALEVMSKVLHTGDYSISRGLRIVASKQKIPYPPFLVFFF